MSAKIYDINAELAAKQVERLADIAVRKFRRMEAEDKGGPTSEHVRTAVISTLTEFIKQEQERDVR